MKTPPKDPTVTAPLRGGCLGSMLAGIFFVNAVFTTAMLGGQLPAPMANLLPFWFLCLLAGLVLGPIISFAPALILTLLLRNAAHRFRTRKHFLIMGMVSGTTLGIFTILIPFSNSTVKWDDLMGEPFLVSILAAGLGMGLGCALAVPFRAREEVSD